MSDINKTIGNISFVDTAVGQIAIQMDTPVYGGINSNTDWDSDPMNVDKERIVQWGADDNYPKEIRDILEQNNLGPGILDRKVGLLYGQGPRLYREVYEEGDIIQRWIKDAELQEWLDSWDYLAYIRECAVEYTHLNGHFTKYNMSKGIYVGTNWITHLECIPSTRCRMCWPKSNIRMLSEVTNYLVGEFEEAGVQTYKKYHAFDKRDVKYPKAIKYHSLRSFGRMFYSNACFHGSLPWLRNANTLPRIIKHLNDNMIAASYIVHMPQEYWDQKVSLIEEAHPEWDNAKITVEVEKLRGELVQSIADVMAGDRNAGKFFACVDFVDPDGHPQSWRIEPIEMNIDKYIDAQAKISRIADSSTTSGFGLSPALANLIIDGKSDSGSQMLYALKIFYGADTQIAEDIVLEAINDAMHINFPDKKDIKLGFFRRGVNKEDNVTASKRLVNQQ